MSEKQLHRVRIAAQDLPIRSTEKEEYVQELAHQLDTRILTISQSGKGCTILEAAILCALDLLDEKVKSVALIKTQQAQIVAQLERLHAIQAPLKKEELAELSQWEKAAAELTKADPSPFTVSENGDQVSLFEKGE